MEVNTLRNPTKGGIRIVQHEMDGVRKRHIERDTLTSRRI